MPDRLFTPFFNGFGSFHHLGRLMADISAVGPQAGVALAFFRLFHLIRPGARAARRFTQAADVPLQPLVFRLLKSVPAAPVFPPRRKIASLHLGTRPVEREDVADATV